MAGGQEMMYGCSTLDPRRSAACRRGGDGAFPVPRDMVVEEAEAEVDVLETLNTGCSAAHKRQVAGCGAGETSKSQECGGRAALKAARVAACNRQQQP
jgi:hypothetical protein